MGKGCTRRIDSCGYSRVTTLITHMEGRLICPSDGKPASEWRKLCDIGRWATAALAGAFNPVLQQQWHNMVTSLLQRCKVIPPSCARVKGTEGHWQHSITQVGAPSWMNASDNTCWRPIVCFFRHKCPQLSALGCGIYESIMEREMMMGRRRGIRYFQGTNALLYSA